MAGEIRRKPLLCFAHFGLIPRFDYYISETLATSGIAFERPTRVCQAALYKKWHGYAPPGTCTLVELPQDLTSNKFQCRYIALCPTMRSPEDVSWARDISYDCMWSLLNELDIHNAEAEKKGQVVVRTILMTGFGTGVGKVSAARCAKQMSLAIKQFGIAKTEPDKWGAVEWSDVEGIVAEIKQTRLL
jgi:O-acetyl-ADP-ribose deacetylase (regulator of RNase III)